MALNDFYSNFHLIIRWLHVIAGILWIGHLYFFNFVNSQLQPTLDGETKKKVNPILMPKALFWFRWGAMITFLAGLILFWLVYMYPSGPNSNFTGDDGGITERAIWILLGMTFGFIMWFNVWFVIWPAQKKLIGALLAGQAPDAALAKRAANASKINTYLSGPMLFGMLAPAHYGSINAVTAIVCIAIAELVIYMLYFHAPRVGNMKAKA